MRTNSRTIGQGRLLLVILVVGVVGTLAITSGTLRGQDTEPAPVPPAAAPKAPASAPAPEAPAAPPAVAPAMETPPAVAPAPEAPASAAPAADAPAAPATEPAAPTAMSPAPASATGFSEEETLLVKSVTDGGEFWQATPMYILLKHAALLPDGNNPEADKLDLNDLWRAPEKYRERLKPLTFEGWYAGVCVPEKTMANEWWPTGTFHLMRVCVSTEKGSPIVLVALTKAPPSSLAVGTKVNFVGYFYKNTVLPLQEKQSEKRVNPLLVAKAAEIGTLEAAETHRPFNSWGIVAAIVTLLGLGLYFQMRVRASKQQAAMHQRVAALTHQPEEDADFDVDPDLAQEVERFEAEQEAAHQPSDAQKTEER